MDHVATVEWTLTDNVRRGAVARGQPDQAPPAVLQRAAEGRQELPVHQGHAGRRLPAHRAHPETGAGREPVLRPVRVGQERGQRDGPDPAALPVPDLHHPHPRRRARPASTLPPLRHQALPGAVHPGDPEGRLPGRHRAGGCSSWRVARNRSRATSPRDGDGLGGAGLRARGRGARPAAGGRAHDRERRRWRPTRRRSWTSWASHAEPARRRCSCSWCAVAAWSAATCSS